MYGSIGVRHEGGVTLIQAWVGNVGTCRSDAKGDAQAGSPRKCRSTDAGHRDGVARRREEGSVMGLDRRGVVVRKILGLHTMCGRATRICGSGSRCRPMPRQRHCGSCAGVDFNREAVEGAYRHHQLCT